VQNVLGDTFYSHIASPRAKMALSAQMFMEAIHNDFFEMVLNSFNMDQEAMYKIADDNEVLRKKRHLVANAADSISETYGKIDADTLEGKKAILNAILINNIIQEGIFFYSAFAIFFAMRET
jgi:ribonucleoside-diphosphate reductase beta chain